MGMGHLRISYLGLEEYDFLLCRLFTEARYYVLTSGTITEVLLIDVREYIRAIS